MHISSLIMGTCSVIGCENKRGNTLLNKKFGITFHIFPKDPERRYKWLQALKRGNFTPSDRSTVCSKHFLPTDFKDDEIGYRQRNLKNDTVPSVFPALAPKLQPDQGLPGGNKKQFLLQNIPQIPSLNESNKFKQTPPCINLEDDAIEEDKDKPNANINGQESMSNTQEKYESREEFDNDLYKPPGSREDFETEDVDGTASRHHDNVNNPSRNAMTREEKPTFLTALDHPEPGIISMQKVVTEKEFCLRWKDSEANLLQSFVQLRSQGQFLDCTIATDDDGVNLRYLRAHKVLLAACSEFFKSLLNDAQMTANPNPIIYLGGMSATYLERILDFIYHGEVNVAQEDLVQFLKVAETLKIKGLMEGFSESQGIPSSFMTTRSSKRKSSTSLPHSDSNKKLKTKPSSVHTKIESDEIKEDMNIIEGAFSSPNEIGQDGYGNLILLDGNHGEDVKNDRVVNVIESKRSILIWDYFTTSQSYAVCNACKKYFRSGSNLASHLQLCHKQLHAELQYRAQSSAQPI